MTPYMMPFGRYRGLPLSSLPDDYLKWLDALPDLRPRLRAAVDGEVSRRRAAEPIVQRQRTRPTGVASDNAPAPAVRTHQRKHSGGAVIDFAAARARIRKQRGESGPVGAECECR